ncbi:MAG: hypothetical protein PVH19_06295 [Planctomycetia bacterium]|jgi:hypothetical protein
MGTMFLFCAVVGGVTLLIQFVLTMFGFIDIDVPEGMDGLDGAADGFDAADALDAADAVDAADGFDASDMGVDIDGTTHAALPVTFGLFSFRAITAALTFFGLTGLLMQSLDSYPPISMLASLAAGFGAMVLVAWVFRTLYQLQADGTAHIKRAINHRASVYLPIPAEGEGKGKVQVNLQGRTMEYEAITAGRAIHSGDTVLITRIVSSDTVEVEPAFEIEEVS